MAFRPKAVCCCSTWPAQVGGGPEGGGAADLAVSGQASCTEARPAAACRARLLDHAGGPGRRQGPLRGGGALRAAATRPPAPFPAPLQQRRTISVHVRHGRRGPPWGAATRPHAPSGAQRRPSTGTRQGNNGRRGGDPSRACCRGMLAGRGGAVLAPHDASTALASADHGQHQPFTSLRCILLIFKRRAGMASEALHGSTLFSGSRGA